MFHVKRFPLAVRYADWLTDAGVVRGLIGPREAPRIWERHILNCVGVADLLPNESTVADIGSGAGLPGLVIAIARPDLQVTLIEPLLRRTTFLTEVVEDLELSNVEVLRGRADALHGERTFDTVTSRAVAPLDRLLEWSMPLVAANGSMIAMKGGSVESEIHDAGETLARLGCAAPVLATVGSGDHQAGVIKVSWADPTRVGLPSAKSSRPSKPSNATRTRAGKKGNRRS